MKTKQVSLFEKDGVFYYLGVPLKIGEHVKIGGIPWKILGGGRSPGKSQAPFLWVRNEQCGTSLFSPLLDPNSPRRQPRPVEKEFVPKIDYSKDWRVRSVADIAMSMTPA